MADPHADSEILTRGPSVERARAVMILLHGRGGRAADILGLAPAIAGEDMAVLAPQAAGQTWYPQSFRAPLAANQPHLDSALGLTGRLIAELLGRGVPSQRLAIAGFSQGACLACETVSRHAMHYGAVVAFTGGLIGPDGTPWQSESLAGTQIFLGSADVDPHVPPERVRATAENFTGRGAMVDLRIYPGLGHSINDDEIARARALTDSLG